MILVSKLCNSNNRIHNNCLVIHQGHNGTYGHIPFEYFLCTDYPNYDCSYKLNHEYRRCIQYIQQILAIRLFFVFLIFLKVHIMHILPTLKESCNKPIIIGVCQNIRDAVISFQYLTTGFLYQFPQDSTNKRNTDK